MSLTSQTVGSHYSQNVVLTRAKLASFVTSVEGLLLNAYKNKAELEKLSDQISQLDFDLNTLVRCSVKLGILLNSSVQIEARYNDLITLFNQSVKSFMDEEQICAMDTKLQQIITLATDHQVLIQRRQETIQKLLDKAQQTPTSKKLRASSVAGDSVHLATTNIFQETEPKTQPDHIFVQDTFQKALSTALTGHMTTNHSMKSQVVDHPETLCDIHVDKHFVPVPRGRAAIVDDNVITPGPNLPKFVGNCQDSVVVPQPHFPVVHVNDQKDPLVYGQMPHGYDAKMPMVTQELCSQIKLKKVDLPIFDGDPLEWPQFWDMFNSCINSQTSYSDVLKAHQLKLHLTGKALNAIKDIRIEGQNYREMLSRLFSRYDNSNYLKCSFLKRLQTLECPKDNLEKLQSFYDEVNYCVTELKRMGEQCTDTAVAYPLINKLPFRIRDKVLNKIYNRQDEKPLDILLTVLNDKVIQLRWMDPLKGVTNDPNKPPTQNSQQKNTQSSGLKPPTLSMMNTGRDTSSNQSSSSQNKSKQSPFCYFCQFRVKHYPHACDRYDSIQARKERLIELKRCTKCGLREHTADTCSNRLYCPICKRDNHKAIFCFKNPIFKTSKFLRDELKRPN